MQPAPTPFYLDWTFWSWAVALAALVLSQIPPLRERFAKAQVTLEIHGSVYLQHMVGYPNSGLYVSVRNTGGKSVRVLGFELSFTRDATNVSLESSGYFTGPNEKSTVLLTPFTLRPGEEWAHSVSFLQILDRAANRHIGQLRSNLRKDLSTKYEENKRLPEEQQVRLVEAGPETLAPLQTLFAEKFMWLPGEYQLALRMRTEHQICDSETTGRFTVFESDSEELRAYADNYKFGYGVAFDHASQAGLWMRVTRA